MNKGAEPVVYPDTVFWTASCAVCLSACRGLIKGLFVDLWAKGAIFDLIDEVYLLFFGVVMFILDNPGNQVFVMQYKGYIWKYCMFLRMLTGRGIWYMFLGIMSTFILYEEYIWLFSLLGLYVFCIGLTGFIIGLSKSRKLERVRTEFQRKEADVRSYFRHYAAENPTQGMNADEFSFMVVQVSNLEFSDEDMDYIFIALATGRNGRLMTQADMNEWISTGPLPLLGSLGIPSTLL
jgi:hypothetical protein